MIGYYGNGKPKYENDEVDYGTRGYSPTYNPNQSGRANFDRLNNNTHKANNGTYSKHYF